MAWLTALAVYFIVWWLILFAVLPVSLRTQDDAGEFTPGTVRSAPRGPHVLRAMLRTTVIATVLFGVGYGAVRWFDLSFDDIPRIVPQGPSGKP
jgi:predicted secreted protein